MKKRPPTWREMNMDTAPEIEAIQFEKWRTAPSWWKIASMESLNKSVKFLAFEGIKQRHPDETEQQLRWRYCALLHGEALTQSALGSFSNL